MNVNQGETTVNNHGEIVRPTEYSEEIVTRNYNAPRREIYYQPILSRQIINQRENLNFIPEEDTVHNLNQITNRPVIRDAQRTETV